MLLYLPLIVIFVGEAANQPTMMVVVICHKILYTPDLNYAQSVLTSQWTNSVSMIKTNPLMLFTEVIGSVCKTVRNAVWRTVELWMMQSAVCVFRPTIGFEAIKMYFRFMRLLCTSAASVCWRRPFSVCLRPLTMHRSCPSLLLSL
jgi:hypothetical protein